MFFRYFVSIFEPKPFETMSLYQDYKDMIFQLKELKTNIKRIGSNQSRFLLNVKSMEEKFNTAVLNYGSGHINVDEYIRIVNSIRGEMTIIVDFLLNRMKVFI